MVEIRIATLEDLPFLINLENNSFSPHDRFSPSQFKRAITLKTQLVYIINKNDIPVGSAIIFLYEKSMRIYSIAVLPEYQKEKFGSILMEEILKRAEDKFYQKVSLEVNTTNTKAINFYNKFGFKKVKELPNYYGENSLGHKMELVLHQVDKTLKNVIVVDEPLSFLDDLQGVEVISAERFINDPHFKTGDFRVFNLCSSFAYQTKGYYVSLFASAREFRAIPNIATIEDFNDNAIIKSIGGELKDLIKSSFKNVVEDKIELKVYFGKTTNAKYASLAYRLFKMFPSPFLLLKFAKDKKWGLVSVNPISPRDIVEDSFLSESALQYFSQKKHMNSRFKNYKYDLAILVNEEDKAPPSNKMALRRFLKAAHKLGFYTEFITKEDYGRLRQFDALFIRATTNPNDFTYQFSRLAYAEGLVVIDDPWSILRCANKVYLHESMNTHKIKTPHTLFVTAETSLNTIIETLGLPVVIKTPDSSASMGVFKANNAEELESKLAKAFTTSDIILAQEFIKSDFDWRVGVLSGKAIYVCKYFMAKNHWQIYNWKANAKSFDVGGVETLLVEDAPKRVVDLALKAAEVMGDGFYGVDIKEANNQVYLIEVNDNPSVDRGWEDGVLGDKLYELIVKEIYDRIEIARAFKSRLSLPNI